MVAHLREILLARASRSKAMVMPGDAARAMSDQLPQDDDSIAWPASLRLEHGVFESRYQVIRSLSDGGMGEVVLAEHLTLGKRVAIKIMRPQYRGDTETEERFILETRAAARIHHDNVVGISDFGRTADGRMFFVMEYLEGEDLAQTLRKEGPLPWKRVVHVTRHVCRGIGEAHRRGVIHRDVKPANCIRVTRDGDPDFIKVVDFGLAKLFDSRNAYKGPQTIAGVVLGTPGYMAPEVEAGQRPDARVDLYGIGVLMIRLLTGKLPDEGGIRALAGMYELPPSLLKLLYKALREDPDERFQTASAMEEALDYVILVTARPPSLRGIKLGTRLSIGHKMQPPVRGASVPTPQAGPRPVTGPAAVARVAPAANEPEGPVERRTRAIHSGALQPAARLVTQPSVPRVRPSSAAPARSRKWVALVSLGVGLLAGVVVAVWMHMSRETDAAPTPAAVVPVVEAPARPVVPVVPGAAGSAAVQEREGSPAAAPAAAKPSKRRRRAVERASEADASDLKNPFERR